MYEIQVAFCIKNNYKGKQTSKLKDEVLRCRSPSDFCSILFKKTKQYLKGKAIFSKDSEFIRLGDVKDLNDFFSFKYEGNNNLIGLSRVTEYRLNRWHETQATITCQIYPYSKSVRTLFLWGLVQSALSLSESPSPNSKTSKEKKHSDVIEGPTHYHHSDPDEKIPMNASQVLPKAQGSPEKECIQMAINANKHLQGHLQEIRAGHYELLSLFKVQHARLEAYDDLLSLHADLFSSMQRTKDGESDENEIPVNLKNATTGQGVGLLGDLAISQNDVPDAGMLS